jgi:hypothetical protein
MKPDDKKQKPNPQGGDDFKKTREIIDFQNSNQPNSDEEAKLKSNEFGDGSGYDTREDREGK